MATYQGGRFLRAQLESLAGQTRYPSELVVHDDGSHDDTLAVLDSFARVAPFDVRVLTGRARVGYAQNFERALRECSGDIVFFCDQDDVWFPSKIEQVCLAMMSDPSVHLVAHDRVVVDEALRGPGISTLAMMRARGEDVGSYVAGSSTALRRPLVDLVLPFPANVGHDEWVHLVARVLGVGKILDEPLMYYRRHDSNVSVSFVDPHRRSLPVRLVVSDWVRRFTTSVSGQRIRLLATQRDIHAELARRLRSREAQALSPSSLDAALGAEQRANAIGLRLDAQASIWFARARALARARRSGAYANGARGLGALALDLLGPRTEEQGEHGS